MLKLLGILLGGVFLGSAGVEVLNRAKPKLINKVRDKAHKMVDDSGKSLTAIKSAFVEGFNEAAKLKTSS